MTDDGGASPQGGTNDGPTLREVANRCCNGRVVSVLEGGYRIQVTGCRIRPCKGVFNPSVQGGCSAGAVSALGFS